jgi:predicted acylesterase/phospholipase RssA
LIDGLVANTKQFGDLVAKTFRVSDENSVPGFWRGLIRWIYRPSGNTNLLKKLGWYKFASWSLFHVVVPKVFKSPMTFDLDNVANIFTDRGMYSGFQVREFFMDLVILAATRETQFHRGLLKYLKSKYELSDAEVQEIKDALLLLKDFEIGNRSSSNLDKNEILLSYIQDDLANLTFIQLQQITNVNFAMCVSNFTSGFPVYFGYEWTPDFRVMEAVAGSMSIPPAIKPIYNAADVLVDDDGVDGVPFINDKGEFELEDYYIYEHAVKIFLAGKIQDDKIVSHQARVNVNNSLDMSAFLPKLKELVVGTFNVDTGLFDFSFKNETFSVEIGSRTIVVNYPVLKFFYNATYKGMFMDGGYRCNIPYNFFRLRNETIKNLIAIKLDESFPPPIMDAVYDKIKKMVALEELIDASYLDDDNPVLNDLLAQLDKATDAVRAQTELVFAGQLKEWKDGATNEKDRRTRNELHRQVNKNKKAMKRLAKASIKGYRKKHFSAPWSQPVSILNTAFDGYSYGSEKGQVKQISDHNQILPLYDYGVGVYDFDMTKVMPQVQLAQAKAESDTFTFFNQSP